MNRELAEEIARLAAPIYAALLAPWIATNDIVPAETLQKLRRHAIDHASALWLDALEYDT